MDKIMHEYEQIANMVLDKNEGIFIIVSTSFLNDIKHYYFICSNKDKTRVKHVFIRKGEGIENIRKNKNLKVLKMLPNSRRLSSLINYCFNYEFDTEEKNEFDKKSPKFYCYIPNNNKFYTFSEKCEISEQNGFYDLINYLFIYSKVENNYFYRKEIENENLFQLTVMLDDEITYNMERPNKKNRFSIEKKINYELVKKRYYEACDDLCSMMNNYELIMTTTISDYVYIIGNTIDRIKPEVLNWNLIKNNKKDRFENVINLISNKEFIYNSNISLEEKEEIIEKLEIDHQIELIMKLMKNEEILELSKKTNNWNVKLNIMKYIHTDK